MLNIGDLARHTRVTEVRCRIDVKYALGLELEDPGLPPQRAVRNDDVDG